MTELESRTYFWDFFGPRAAPTAAHFKRHLTSFLAEHGVSQLEPSDFSLRPGHHGVGLLTPAEHRELIEKALRPKRFEAARAIEDASESLASTSLLR